MSKEENRKDDDKTALGSLGRQEILTFLIIAMFGGFVVIVYTIIYLILSNPDIVSNLTVTCNVDLGRFVDRFDEILIALLVLLGVGVGTKVASKIKQ